MYRVELKDIFLGDQTVPKLMFLMYRVELKGPRTKPSKLPGLVPNVPCGVGNQVGGTLWQGGTGS